MIKFQREYGYLYIAHGRMYMQEAIRSAKSVKETDQNAHITLITDRADHIKPFDVLIPKKSLGSFSGKINYLSETLYKKTIFLDTDTKVYDDCSSLLHLLDRFDLCMTMGIRECEAKSRDKNKLTGFYPHSTGFMLYNSSSKVISMFKEAAEHDRNNEDGYWDKKPNRPDQHSMALAYFNSDVRVYVLPSTWNFCPFCCVNLRGKVKVVHGRGFNFDKTKKKADVKHIENRCWIPSQWKIIT